MKINGESHGLRLAGPCHSFQSCRRPALASACSLMSKLYSPALPPPFSRAHVLPAASCHFPPAHPSLYLPSQTPTPWAIGSIRPIPDAAASGRRPAVYTVWKRSSMGFQGTDGFCVYDDAGRLAFRVDNYSRRRKLSAGELLLMDGQGTPLLSLRPQVITLPFLKHRCSFSSLLISSFLEATYKVIAKVSNLLISNP